jgi:drug/metabolite transporter (DMT)-like permease
LSRKGWLLFIALCIIWGIPYLFIRIAVAEVSPPVLVFLRTAPATLLLLPLALRQSRGHWRELWRAWYWIIAFALLETTIPWLLLSSAEQKLSSSLAGLLIATVPLLGALFSRFRRRAEHIGGRRVAGLFLGFGGVAALVGLDIGHLNTVALIEMAVVAILYAIAPFVVSDHLSDVPSLGAVCLSLAFTSIVYAPIALPDFPTSLSTEVIVALAILAVVCTATAFYLFFDLIKEVGPIRSQVITYINPAVAILAGVIVLGEPLTVGMAIGFPLVLIGCWLATRPGTRREPVPALPADPPAD